MRQKIQFGYGGKNPSLVSTALYQSRQLGGGHHITTKCDVYSLAVILYELFFGHVPWKTLVLQS